MNQKVTTSGRICEQERTECIRPVSAERPAMQGNNSLREQTQMRALEQYREHIEAAAKHSRNVLLPNSSPEHFSIVMEALLQRAQKHVLIYSNHLSRYSHSGHRLRDERLLGRPVWASDKLIQRAKAFLHKKDTLLEVIVRYQLDADSEDLKTHPFLDAIIKDENREGAVTLRIANTRQNPSFRKSMFPQNFVVIDEMAYRHEQDDDIHAVVQFGKDDAASVFARVFEKMAHEIDKQAMEGALVCSCLYSAGDHDANRPSELTDRTRILAKTADLEDYFAA